MAVTTEEHMLMVQYQLAIIFAVLSILLGTLNVLSSGGLCNSPLGGCIRCSGGALF